MNEGSLEDRLNYGIAVLNDKPCGAEATIVATGLGRSGTTMLARIMEESGLEMGKKLTTNTREVKRLQTMVKANDRLAFKSFCKKQSRLTPKWGFKLPGFRSVMRSYESSMSNPRFVIIFRDVLSISIRNGIAVGSELLPNMLFSMRDYLLLLNQVTALKSPVLLISYEKALHYPDRTVAAMAEFMGLTLSERQIAKIAEIAVLNADPDYLFHRTGAQRRRDNTPDLQ
jgi:hypothetical protein